uniref:Uncharacterized protein n=1 Tax=Schistosoma mansoni TaxID=6183 RepID=A0A146MIJ6_SCHMA
MLEIVDLKEPYKLGLSMCSVLWIFSYLALLFYLFVILFCITVGLFYVTELVEEYIVTTGKIIRYTIYAEIVLHFHSSDNG